MEPDSIITCPLVDLAAAGLIHRLMPRRVDPDRLRAVRIEGLLMAVRNEFRRGVW